jgi:hypothetical protein
MNSKIKKGILGMFIFSILNMVCTLLKAQDVFFTATKAYLGVQGGGSYRCWNEDDLEIPLNQVTRPLIFVEGIDPSTNAEPDGRNFTEDIHDILNDNAYIPMLPALPNSTTLLRQIQNLDYDLIVLNFTDGGDYIQRNAYVLEELINIVNSTVGEDAQPVVVGYSMGGVVARYALADMEADSIPHWCPLFVSFDSPQQGANVPLGLQAFTQLGSVANSINPDLAYAVANLNCNAAKQLLRYRLSSALTTSNLPLPKNQDYVDFFTELTSLNNCNGFPTQCRNIGISLGSGQGVPQNYNVDLDGTAGLDQQHSGFEIANINGRTTDATMPVWDATCDGRASPLRVTFGTRVQDIGTIIYPNSNNRGNYTNLANVNRDPDIAINFIHPSWLGGGPTTLLKRNWRTAISDGWAYDMVPGSNLNLYRVFFGVLAQLDDPIALPPDDWDNDLPFELPSISLQLACANTIGNSAAFVPTVSALCYDYRTPFDNIDATADRLDFTPFDDVVYATANLDHDPLSSPEPTTQPNINAWLLAELSNWRGSTCRWGTRTVTGTIASGNAISENQANKIVVQNFDAQANSQGHLTAATEIELLAGTDIKQSNDFIMDIEPCEPKACHFTLRNQTNLYRQAAPESFENDALLDNTAQMEQPLIYPNPTSGQIKISVSSESTLQIFDLTGILLATLNITPSSTLNYTLLNSGIYLAKITNKQGYVFTQKIICNKN